MNPQIIRALLTTAVFTAAYVFLSLFGLGFIVILLLAGYLAITAARYLRSRPTSSSARVWLAKPPRHEDPSHSQDAHDAQARRDRERREMDCGLTHLEREQFKEIVRGAEGPRAE